MKINTPLAGLAAAILGSGAIAFLAFQLFLQPTANDAAGRPPLAAHDAAASPHSEGGSMEERVATLAARLRDNPADGEGWAMLGRSHAALNRFAEAATAFERAMTLLADDANLLVDYADALAASRNGDLRGEPEKLIRRALSLDPGHVKGLALAGTAAFNRQDFKAAVGHWQRALAVVPPDSGFVPTLRNGIADAESRLRKPAAARQGVVIGGKVSLDPALRDQVGPDDTVFVLVRAADGGKMPLAALRTTVRELPADFAFNDDAAMVPGGRRLSDYPRLLVVARLSRSGEATPRPGDYEGEAGPVAPGRGDVRVSIKRPLP